MHKILIIENQYHQFKQLYNELKADYDVYPKLADDPGDISDFKALMNPVRVYLSTRYNESHFLQAQERLATLINDLNPELIIIDYVLVGHKNANTGINLAYFIKEDKLMKDKEKPILFLSRTPFSNSKVIGTIGKVREPQHWLCKGYSGGKIFEKDFMEDVVKKEIDKLIAKSNLERVNLSLALIFNLISLEENDFKLLHPPDRDSIIGQLNYEEIQDILDYPEKLGPANKQEIDQFVAFLTGLFTKYKPTPIS